MGDLSPLHLLIVFVVALVVLGPSRLPEAGAALGRTIREFRRAVTRVADEAGMATPAPPNPPEEAPAPAAPMSNEP